MLRAATAKEHGQKQRKKYVTTAMELDGRNPTIPILFLPILYVALINVTMVK